MNKHSIPQNILRSRFVGFFATGLVAVCLLAVPGISFASPAADPTAGAGEAEESALKAEINQQSQSFGGERGAGYGDVALMKDPRLIAAEGIRIFLTFLGIMFATYTVYGGYLYMTSAGKEEKVEKGRSIIVHGAIGVMVIFLSYTTVYYVVRTVWYGQNTEFISYYKWGTLPVGSQSVEGPDPLRGHRDPLEQTIPTPKFYKDPAK